MSNADDLPELLLESLDAVPLEVRADWERFLRNQVADIWSRPALSPRNRSLVTVAGLTMLRSLTELRTQVKVARANGLRRIELCEAMMQVAGYGGLGPALEGMAVLKGVFEAEPASAAEPIPEGDSWEPLAGRHERSRTVYPLLNPRGAATLHSMTEAYPIHGGPDRAPFTPDGPWLSWVHDTSFGDLWSRPHLTYDERERVTTAVLVVLGRKVELRSHFTTNLAFGITWPEIGEAIFQLAPYAGFPVAIDAMLVAREVKAQLDAEAAEAAEADAEAGAVADDA
jgi:4-carboxymuconolactone decarboxylase